MIAAAPESPSFFLGIDPGLTGALALFYPGPGPTKFIIIDMPTYETTVNSKKRKEIDLYALARFFDLNARSIRLALVEEPHAMPGQGVSSTFTFGFNCGVMQAMVASAFIPLKRISPSQWKRQLGLTKDKDDVRRRASEILPEHSEWWARAKDHGRAEAALLAKMASGMEG